MRWEGPVIRPSNTAREAEPNRAASRLIALLLMCDIGFIALHLDAQASGAAGRLHRLDGEGSYAGMFQDAKQFGSFLGLGLLAWRHRAGMYVAWALVLLHLLLDDSLALNARGGAYLAEHLMLPGAFGLEPREICALAVSLAACTILAGVIGLTHAAVEPAQRDGSARLPALLLAMLSLGPVTELLRIAWPDPSAQSLMVLADGGGMIAMTLILSHVTTRARIRS